LAVDEHSFIPVISGPTAAGKSALVLALAARWPMTIIVADSRQIYRRFDVGTAKPSDAELAATPHRGVDLVDATERYSAAAWAKAADRWIDEAIAAGHTPVIVGGTGFYLRALFSPLFEEPELDERRRLRLQAWLESLSFHALRRWTERLDPQRAHLGRAQLLRAVEVALLSGKRLSELHRERARPARRRARYLVVDPGQALGDRIAARTDSMLAGGWVEEVQTLLEKVPENAPAWKATGYRTVRELALGRLSRVEARESIVIQTRQYAKRQRTWFRHQLDASEVTRVDPSDPASERIAERWLTDVSGRHA
jgi:tRNA dimethylallyltransferase